MCPGTVRMGVDALCKTDSCPCCGNVRPCRYGHEPSCKASCPTHPGGDTAIMMIGWEKEAESPEKRESAAISDRTRPGQARPNQIRSNQIRHDSTPKPVPVPPCGA
ncbi:hypothetical protein DSM19430T_12670 [Desulfovibrio psychrotolerans]|uniref:Uncharacterized protein n=1 Tax=Desulfovibrio psychrotolerans TaxID=415242 RepID=A0A7J0BS91_9BACT|nr:hypothetical protein DSM19430T_12670 [Desulfovibrio psychrotolerans]